MRLRFAPSPTGPLNVGGVRSALYNYLLAKKNNGQFILRIEDTDQKRYVPGSEEYIAEALDWLGIAPDESPSKGGAYGPYRQSERKALYKEYAEQLISQGNAYYAFDTAEELDAWRAAEQKNGVHSPKYDHATRSTLKNSISLSAVEVENELKVSDNVVVRMKLPENETVEFFDRIRGKVSFNTKDLDDKVLLKADGMPTYHLAVIVDDHLMKITDIVRGEEWLSSTAHHVLLYRYLGWEDSMPKFSHLPLILKPEGKGKLSKRDSAKFGFPVFPLEWNSEDGESHFEGFREHGFMPEALINFLAFLGWNPGTEQEMFSLEELVKEFSFEKIGKSGARFDYNKAKWFNQQYIINTDNEVLTEMVAPLLENKGFKADKTYISSFCGLMKERVETLNEFVTDGNYFFEKPTDFDLKTIKKKYKRDNKPHFEELVRLIDVAPKYDTSALEAIVKGYIQDNNLKFGEVLPIIRIAVSGTMKGPDVFQMMELIGKAETTERLSISIKEFDSLLSL